MPVYVMLTTLTDIGRKAIQETWPSNEIMAKLATRPSARGNSQTLTLAAITIESLIDTLKEKETPW